MRAVVKPIFASLRTAHSIFRPLVALETEDGSTRWAVQVVSYEERLSNQGDGSALMPVWTFSCSRSLCCNKQI